MSINNFFDWSSLDREKIAQHVFSIYPFIKGKALSAEEFHSIIKHNLKSLAPFKIKKSYNWQVDPGNVYIGGTYYCYLDQDYERCLELSFNYYEQGNSIQLKKYHFRKICLFIADIVLHEIIHMRQYRRRNFKPLPDYPSRAEKSEIRKEQSYLGCSDEIDAYAFNIACELNYKFKSDQQKIIQYLNKPLKNNGFKNTWRIYLHAFEYDHNHPIIKRMKKKVVRYLPAAEIGKPYKNSDWINY
jgi:hypothetical protein